MPLIGQPLDRGILGKRLIGELHEGNSQIDETRIREHRSSDGRLSSSSGRSGHWRINFRSSIARFVSGYLPTIITHCFVGESMNETSASSLLRPRRGLWTEQNDGANCFFNDRLL